VSREDALSMIGDVAARELDWSRRESIEGVGLIVRGTLRHGVV
jgi:hypothetical protein